MTTAPSRSAGFPTTNWQEIERSLDELGTASPTMDQLVQRYLPPLRRLLLKKGVRADDVDDALQGFIMEKVLSGKVLQGSDAAKGRFRSYLARSLLNFLITEARKAGHAKKQWARSLHLEDFEIISSTDDKDDYDLEWARQVIRHAHELMQQQCQAIGRVDLWNVFYGRMLRPAYEDAEPVPYQELMEQLQLDGLTTTFNLLTTAKRMYRRCLQQTVVQYAPDDPEQEMKRLLNILNRRRAKKR